MKGASFSTFRPVAQQRGSNTVYPFASEPCRCKEFSWYKTRISIIVIGSATSLIPLQIKLWLRRLANSNVSSPTLSFSHTISAFIHFAQNIFVVLAFIFIYLYMYVLCKHFHRLIRFACIFVPSLAVRLDIIMMRWR